MQYWKSLRYCKIYQNVTQRHEVSTKRYWKTGSNRLAPHNVATNLRFIKSKVSAKHTKANHNKRYACSENIAIDMVPGFSNTVIHVATLVC